MNQVVNHLMKLRLKSISSLFAIIIFICFPSINSPHNIFNSDSTVAQIKKDSLEADNTFGYKNILWIRGSNTNIDKIILTPDNKYLLTYSFGGNIIRFWDRKSGYLLKFYNVSSDSKIQYLSLSDDGLIINGHAVLDDSIHLVFKMDFYSGQIINEQIKFIISKDREYPFNVVSPDGRYSISKSRENDIMFDVIENATNRVVSSVRKIDSSITGSPVFSPDSKWVAIDTDLGIYLLNLFKPEELKKVADIDYYLQNYNSCFSDNGKFLILQDETSGYNEEGNRIFYQSITVWDIADNEIVGSYGLTDLNTYAISPDGRSLCVNLYGPKVLFVDLASGVLTDSILIFADINNDMSNISNLSYSQDGRSLFISSYESSFVYEILSKKLSKSFTSHNSNFSEIKFSHNGKLIASSPWGGFVKLWDYNTGEEITKLIDSESENKVISNYSVSFSPDDKFLGTSNTDSTIILWDLQSTRPIKRFKQIENYINIVSISPDGKQITAGFGKSRNFWFYSIFTIWDLNDNALKDVMTFQDWAGYYLLSDNWKYVITVNWSGKVVVSDFKIGKEVLSFNNNGFYVFGFSSDANIAAFCGSTNMLIMNIEKKDTLFFGPKISDICAVCFSPDTKYIATAHDSGIINIWNIHKGERIYTYDEYKYSQQVVDWSPDGKYIVSGTKDGSIILWDTGVFMK